MYEEDEKTQFLTELKELLAKYDAEICANYIDECVVIYVGDEEISYPDTSVNADNVFDYGKDL